MELIQVTTNVNTVILLLQLVVGVVLPLLVGLVTTRATSPFAKALLLAVLSLATSIATGILNAFVTNTPYDLVGQFIIALGTFITAVGTYFGIWSRPLGSGESVSSKLLDLGRTNEGTHQATSLK